MYGNSPITASELRKLDKGEISSAEAEEFAEHLKNIHEATYYKDECTIQM